ncbi:MAG: sugar ABC transporter permease [Phycicoccus sp.]|nr:sugar ABC transporter permease [Phycicoccus sp.]
MSKQSRAAWILALPFLSLFTVFTAWPVISSLYMSFTDIKSRDLHSPFNVSFVGLDNYAKVFGDESFRKSVLNTFYFVLVGVPLTLGLALAAAIALDKGITRFRTLFRVGYYTPVVTSIVAVAVVWRFLLQPDNGLVNTVLGWVGINGPDWLQNTTWSMPSLIVMASWRNFGTAMIIFLAGLQSVPIMLHEAASIDGASAWQRFRHITLPMLRPTMLFVTVTTGIGYLQFFEEPFVMTQGGPLDSTLSMSMYTFKQFSFGNYGFAASMGYVLFVIIVALTAVQFRFLRSNTD